MSIRSEGRIIVEGMNAMGYDAMALGRLDLALGLQVLKEREEEADFAFLSANLVDPQDYKPVFDPYVLLERQGVRIGIIGLSEPEAVKAIAGDIDLIVLEPLRATLPYVRELRDKVDILIVLSHQGLALDKDLASRLPEIDVFISGNDLQLMREPVRVGNTLIVQQGYRGEWLGRLEAHFDAQGVPQEYKADFITLGPDYEDDPEVAAIVQKYKESHPSPTPRPTAT